MLKLIVIIAVVIALALMALFGTFGLVAANHAQSPAPATTTAK